MAKGTLRMKTGITSIMHYSMSLRVEKTSTTNPLSHTFIPHTELSVPVLDLSF